MAITINGSGTITGVSAGGLPDGCVDNDTLANSSVTVNGTSIDLGASDTITAGKILQIVQGTNDNHGNYSSVDWQQSNTYVSITPTNSSSKFLIKATIYGGVSGNDVGCSMNFYDSLNGSTTPIAPNNTSGGDNNGSSGSRLAAYFGMGSWAGDGNADDWWIGCVQGEYLYTPSYQNTTARTFGVLLRQTFGYTWRENMNGQNNTADPRDMRLRSSITVMEIAG